MVRTAKVLNMEEAIKVTETQTEKQSENLTLMETPSTDMKPLQTNKVIISKSNIIGLPKLFEDKGFSNLELKTDFLKSTVEFCKLFYNGQTEKKSLVLCGNVGNGKTHIAIAILKNLVPLPGLIEPTRKQNALFLVADDFFMMLNDAVFEKKSKLQLIREWLRNDIVLLDDLGTYNMTPAKIENLYTFINYAYLEQRRIIITTNFTLKDFDQFDKRIASRLVEMAHVIAFQEPDYRKKNRQ